MRKKLAIVILNYNDSEVTSGLVKCIQTFDNIDHIIVVDNCSTDNSYNVLSSFAGDKCDVIRTEVNGGYSYGNNYGIKYAIQHYNCDYLCIANPDVLFSYETIDSIRDALDNNDYDLVAPIMVDRNDEVSNRPYWNLPTFFDDVLMCFCLGRRLLDRKKRMINYQSSVMDAEVLPGSLLVFKAEPFISVGMFDENVFLYCEERIISKKFLNNGYKIGLLTNCRYQHLHSVTTSKFIKKIKMNEIMSNSRYYYEITYNNINSLQRGILKIAMAFSVVELNIIRLVRRK